MSTTAMPHAAVRGRPARLARDLHPGAWWAWAIGMATAAGATTNPIVLGLIVATVGIVVAARRGDAPWAGGFGAYLVAGLVIVGIRVVFRVLLDGSGGAHVLFTLPELPLPDAAQGVSIGGPVSLEGVLAAVYDGLRLATLVLCIGAANVLANPKRLLKAVPGVLHELGVAVTVALTLAPQLVESARRVSRARRLRGEVGRRSHWFRQVVIPVLTDALDRSLLLAAAMDTRGFGRTASVPARARRTAAGLVLAGLVGTCIGVYGLLDGTAPALLGLPVLLAGTALAAAGAVLGGRQVGRTRYRPDPWRAPEWAVALCGVGVAAATLAIAAADPVALTPLLDPLTWPDAPVAAVIAVLLGALPAVLSPPPPVDAAAEVAS